MIAAACHVVALVNTMYKSFSRKRGICLLEAHGLAGMQAATAEGRAGEAGAPVQAAARVLQAVAAAWTAAGHDLRQLVGAVVERALRAPEQARLPLLAALQQALPQVRSPVSARAYPFVTGRSAASSDSNSISHMAEGIQTDAAQVGGLKVMCELLVEASAGGESDGAPGTDWCTDVAASLSQQVIGLQYPAFAVRDCEMHTSAHQNWSSGNHKAVESQ